MKILFNPSYHTYVSNYNRANFTSLNKKQDEVSNDIFIKETDKSAFQEHVRELYDRTFNDVAKLNPIIKELNIQKPALLFDYEFANASAVYNFSSNTISLSNAIEEDWFVISQKGATQEDAPVCVLCKSAMLNKKEEIKKCNCSTKKLNPKEKDFVLSALLAHELRHCIQTHIVASTKSTSKAILDHYKQNYKADRKLGRKIKLLYRMSKFLSGKENPSVKSALEHIKLSKYSKNYKPQKLLEDDLVLKFSIDNDDNRYWSTKQHLYRAEMASTSQTTGLEYTANPLEIDANNFECEFIYSKLKDSKGSACRKNVAIALFKSACMDYMEGLEHLKKMGYSDFIKKTN